MTQIHSKKKQSKVGKFNIGINKLEHHLCNILQ